MELLQAFNRLEYPLKLMKYFQGWKQQQPKENEAMNFVYCLVGVIGLYVMIWGFSLI